MTAFIKQHSKVDCDSKIIWGHRISVKSETSRSPHPLVAKLDGKKKEEVMQKGKKGAGGKNIFISQQDPEAYVEKRKQTWFKLELLHAENEGKPKSSQTKITVDGCKIRVNGDIQRPAIEVPSTADILNLSHDEREQRCKIKMKKTWVVTDDLKGSRFYAYSCHVNIAAEVHRAYEPVKLLNADADDVMCGFAYRDAGTNRLKLEYHDDWEVGAGSRIMSAIQESKEENTAVFVVRHFNGQHIGGKRFMYLKNCAQYVLELLINDE